MQKLIVDLDGTQSLVALTDNEIAELEQIAALPKPPRTIDKRRLGSALRSLGRFDSLIAAIDAAGDEARYQWEDTTIFGEDSQLVQSLILGLGWTPAIVDEIFETAYSLS